MAMAAAKIAAAITLLWVATGARAEVKQAAADNFFVSSVVTLAATPAQIYADLIHPEKWWSDERTWSGKASNLSLKAEAGGCFCERWKGGSAEHGRILMALPDEHLRMDASLGPLQELAVKGILSFWIKPADEHGATEVDVEYRVNGSSASGLDRLAPDVDLLLQEQVARLARFIANGNPEGAPAPAPLDQQAIRAQILEEWKAEAAKAAAANARSPEPVKTKPRARSGKD